MSGGRDRAASGGPDRSASGARVRRLLDLLHWPRRVDAQAPLARALVDYARSGRPRHVRVARSGGLRYRLDPRAFFEFGGEQGPIDAALLDACRGRVLDVGAGAGRHALALQERGLPVRAIDVSAESVALMRARGVRDARRVDVWSFVDDRAGAATSAALTPPVAAEVAPPGAAPAPDPAAFDTILFAMQTIGLVGTVDGLAALLAALRRRSTPLAAGGRIVLDSSAPTGPGFAQRVELARAGAAVPAVAAAASQAGETIVSFAYRGARGRPFPWLYVGADALGVIAAEAGFDTSILARLDGSPEYAAVLTRSAGGRAAAQAGQDAVV